mgnify:FL=1
MKILVLVSSPNSTLESVRTDGKKKMRAILGQDKELLFCEYSTIEIQRDGELFITCLGEKIDKPDYFWPVLSATDGFIVENMLQNAGIESILDLKELQTARSKIATYQRFAQHGIRVPDTVVFFKDSERQLLADRFGYPFVVKPDSGFGGEGVELIHNEAELQDYFAKLSYGQAYVAQEYIATSKGRDIRVVILHGKYYFSMERRASDPKEFRSNVHVGGTTSLVTLTDEEKAFCEKAASIFDLPILGLDLMIGDGEYVLAEANAFPGMPGGKMVDAYASVIDHFLEGKA